MHAGEIWGNEWSGVSGPEGKVEVQTLASGGGCGPEGSLQPRQADANVGESGRQLSKGAAGKLWS